MPMQLVISVTWPFYVRPCVLGPDWAFQHINVCLNVHILRNEHVSTLLQSKVMPIYGCLDFPDLYLLVLV